MTAITELSFEEAYQELETIVARFEAEVLNLEESVALYERGQALHAHCQKLLEKAEARIQQLNEDGTLSALDAS
jgi:exodeoxyribonuclease VII small subunit